MRGPGLPARDDPGRLRPRPGQEEQDDVPGRVGAERERGDHAEVAAAAPAAGPEQVRVGAGAGRPDLAVSGDDLQRLNVVAGQPVGPGDHADAAAERQPGDADRRARTAGHRAAVGREPAVEVDEPGPGADGRGAAADAHAGHPGHVHDQAAGRRPARVAVAAAPGGHRDAVTAGEGQAGGYVVRITAVGDPGRVQRVKARVEQLLGGGVAGLARPDQRPGQVPGQRGPVGGGRRAAARWRRAAVADAGALVEAGARPPRARWRARCTPTAARPPGGRREPEERAPPGRRAAWISGFGHGGPPSLRIRPRRGVRGLRRRSTPDS